MRRSSPTSFVDRSILLRTVERINQRGLASAKAVAEELRISQEDARDLLAGEVTEGFLVTGASPADCKYRFVTYALTSKALVTIGVAV